VAKAAEKDAAARQAAKAAAKKAKASKQLTRTDEFYR